MGWKSYQWEVDVLLKRSADPAPFSLNFEPFFAKTEKNTYTVVSTFMGKQRIPGQPKQSCKKKHSRGLTVTTSYLSYRATVTKMS